MKVRYYNTEQIKAYLASLKRHITAVQEAGDALGLNMGKLAQHDQSKYSEEELYPYAQYFFDLNGKPKDPDDRTDLAEKMFNRAWLHHIHHNPHHWQHWLLVYDEGHMEALEMPQDYYEEMVADWLGASLAYTGAWDMTPWLKENMSKIILHPDTAVAVREFIMDINIDDTDYSFLKDYRFKNEERS